jgi:ABC-type glycerol-3-phosphate transport system permease component
VVSAAVVVFFGSLAAYAVTQWSFPGARGVLGLTLFTQLLPQSAVVVPLYLLWNHFGLVGSVGGLAVVYCCLFIPVAVWMLVGFFRSVPSELTEAGLIDGANRLRILWSVVLPVVRPALAAVAVYTVIMAWGEFLFALVFLTGERTTANVSLAALIGEHDPNVGPLMAASTLICIPPLIIFFAMQRQFVAGLTGGSVK